MSALLDDFINSLTTLTRMLLREDIEDAQVCKSGLSTFMSYCLFIHFIHAACQKFSKLTTFYHNLPRGRQAQARLKRNLEPFQSHRSHPSITLPLSFRGTLNTT